MGTGCFVPVRHGNVGRYRIRVTRRPHVFRYAVITATSVEPWGRGSLYHDLAGGRRLELESLNGEVVRRGGEHGIETPLNFAVYAALRPYVDGPPVLP